jgi:MFS transporter, ACS family, allantoate permease
VVFRDKDAPKYSPALITIVVCWSLNIVKIILMWGYYYVQNVKRDRAAEKNADEKDRKRAGDKAFSDLTDWENPDFRYRY